MTCSTRPLAHWKPGFIGAALAAGGGLILYWLIPGLSNLSYDLPFLLRPRQPVPGISIIYMDDTSSKKFDQPVLAAWDRGYHARLVERLVEGGARVIVFDVLFDRPSTNDGPFLAAVSNARAAGTPVIVAAKAEREDRGTSGTATWRGPFPELEKHTTWGFVVGADSTDTIIRRHVENESDGWPSLALRVAEATGPAPPPTGRVTRWINYYGPPGTFPSYRYHRVLDPDFNAATFSNQVVLIGGLADVPYLAGKETDEWPTPWSILGQRKAPGTEISATACLNYMRQEWLRRPSAWTEAIFILGAGLLCGFGFGFCPPRRAASLAALAAFLLGTVVLCSMWQWHTWFPWILIGGVELPLALSWSFIAHTRQLYREKAFLEERFANASRAPTPASEPPACEPRTDMANAGGNATIPSTAVATSPRRADWMPAIPDHTMVRRVGKGAYGEVWLARNAIGTFHAVKIVRREDFEQDEPFEREFRGLQKFMPISRSHPGLVQILHVGRSDRDGCIYYIMEVADDESTGPRINPESYTPRNLAREIKKRGQLPVVECLQLGLDLADALDFLHQQQLIHRDIKPANIIIVKGAPKLADIGLVTDIATTGRDVTYLGTKGYIAPEGPGTPAADVFSLGKVLYEASMGLGCDQFPEFPASILERPDRPALFQFNEILIKACDDDRSRRYASASELHADLLELQHRLSPT